MSLDSMSSAASDVPHIEGDEKVFSDGRREPLSVYELLERDMARSGAGSDEYTRAAAATVSGDADPALPPGSRAPRRSDSPAPGPDTVATGPDEAAFNAMRAELAAARRENEAEHARVLARAHAERDAAIAMLGIRDPRARETLVNTFLAFPVNADPAIEAKNEKIRAAIAKRRFNLFQEGERKTTREDVARIGEAIYNFQQKPWYVRWGLSGVLTQSFASVGAATASLGALAWLGALTAPVSAPVLAAAGAGAGMRKLMHNLIERDNKIGRGKGFMARNPHTAAALVGGLWAYDVHALHSPVVREGLLNFFGQISGTVGAGLKGLLSLISLGTFGKKAALASSLAI